jgi:hypothetical protein
MGSINCPWAEGAVLRRFRGLHKIAAFRDDDNALHLHSAKCPHLGLRGALEPTPNAAGIARATDRASMPATAVASTARPRMGSRPRVARARALPDGRPHPDVRGRSDRKFPHDL